MKNTFVIAGASVDTEILDLFGVVLDIVNERRGKGEQRIGGRDLWSEVTKKDGQFVR